MRIDHRARRKACAAIVLAAAVCVPAARGATKTWDLDSSGHNDGLINNGSGTWDTSIINWTSNGGATNVNWVNGDDAVFGGNPGTGVAGVITVSGTVSANSLTFNPATSGSFTLTGGTINLTGAAMITRNASATIGSVLGGSAGINKSGTASLTLTGANTVTGADTISGGTLILAGSSGSLALCSSYVLSGGTLTLDNTLAAGGNHSSGDRLSMAPITLNAGTLNFINNGTASTETTGNLIAASGASTVSMNGGGSSVLNFGSYTRNAGGTLNFTNLGAFNHTISFTGMSTGFIDQGTFADGSDYAVYDAGGFVRAMTTGLGANFYDTAMNTNRHVKLATSPGGSQATVTILTLNLGTSAGLTLANNATLTITEGGIIKTGHGTGTIAPGNSNTNITTAKEYVVNVVHADDQLTVNERMVGGTSLTKTGLGTLQLGDGGNAWTGTTTVNQGKLKNGTNNVLPDIPLVLNGGTTWDMASFDDTVGNITMKDGAQIMQSASGSNVTLVGSNGSITYSGGPAGSTIATTTLTLAVSGTGTHNFTVADGDAPVDLHISSAIADGGSQNVITKFGAGNLRLSGSGSWGGDTDINAGTLTVDGTVGTASGKVFNVNSTGKLAGSGTISRIVNLNSGGTLSPKGDGSASTIGTLSTNAQVWNGGSTYLFEISSATGAAGTSYDTVNINGSLTINANSGNKMIIKVISHGAVAGWNKNLEWHWNFANLTAAGTIATLAGNFQLDTTDFLDDNDGDAGSFNVDLSGDSKQIRVSYVPEPSSALVLGGMGAVGTLSRRRRRNR